MNVMYTADRNSYKRMTNSELRAAFVIEELFQPGQLNITYTDVDRAVVGGVMPIDKQLLLPTHKDLAADYFCERRELGVINIGAPGTVIVDGVEFPLANRDSLYVSRGSKEVMFSSNQADTPARFYLVSYPAHRTTTTKLVTKADANPIALGSQGDSNTRTIYQSICPGKVDSCQLVMGITELESGNVWNTKPPHTHGRRTEIYMYFDIDEENRVLHLMGEPAEVRSIFLSNGQAIASPSWSIHSGVGTTNYTFVWAMGGENQEFDDMDHLSLADLG
ncbi:MAG: 5-dehydro-4-deoxy-D-glucuronate isomerase [Gammaproteobacteria bacterium]|nr:5-dehydro-4-deoxy-D-glucuronate isomerase [Gammaproteobacteria bacterium]